METTIDELLDLLLEVEPNLLANADLLNLFLEFLQEGCDSWVRELLVKAQLFHRILFQHLLLPEPSQVAHHLGYTPIVFMAFPHVVVKNAIGKPKQIVQLLFWILAVIK